MSHNTVILSTAKHLSRWPEMHPLTSIDFLGKKGEKGGASSRYLLR